MILQVGWAESGQGSWQGVCIKKFKSHMCLDAFWCIFRAWNVILQQCSSWGNRSTKKQTSWHERKFNSRHFDTKQAYVGVKLVEYGVEKRFFFNTWAKKWWGKCPTSPTHSDSLCLPLAAGPAGPDLHSGQRVHGPGPWGARGAFWK